MFIRFYDRLAASSLGCLSPVEVLIKNENELANCEFVSVPWEGNMYDRENPGTLPALRALPDAERSKSELSLRPSSRIWYCM